MLRFTVKLSENRLFDQKYFFGSLRGFTFLDISLFWFPPRFQSLMTSKPIRNLTILKSIKNMVTLSVNINHPNF